MLKDMSAFKEIDLTKSVTDKGQTHQNEVNKTMSFNDDYDYAKLTKEDEAMLTPRRVLTPAEDAEMYLNHLLDDVSKHKDKFDLFSYTLYQSDVVETLFKWYDLADAERFENLEDDYKKYAGRVIDEVLVNEYQLFERQGAELSYKRMYPSIAIESKKDSGKIKSFTHGMLEDKHRMRLYVENEYEAVGNEATDCLEQAYGSSDYPPFVLNDVILVQSLVDSKGYGEMTFDPREIGDRGYITYRNIDGWIAPYNTQEALIQSDVYHCVKFAGEKDDSDIFEYSIKNINDCVAAGIDPKVAIEVINTEIIRQGKNRAILPYITKCLQENIVENKFDRFKFMHYHDSLDTINTAYMQGLQNAMDKNDLRERRQREEQRQLNSVVDVSKKNNNMRSIEDVLRDVKATLTIANTGSDGKGDGKDDPDDPDGPNGPGE